LPSLLGKKATCLRGGVLDASNGRIEALRQKFVVTSRQVASSRKDIARVLDQYSSSLHQITSEISKADASLKEEKEVHFSPIHSHHEDDAPAEAECPMLGRTRVPCGGLIGKGQPGKEEGLSATRCSSV